MDLGQMMQQESEKYNDLVKQINSIRERIEQAQVQMNDLESQRLRQLGRVEQLRDLMKSESDDSSSNGDGPKSQVPEPIIRP